MTKLDEARKARDARRLEALVESIDATLRTHTEHFERWMEDHGHDRIDAKLSPAPVGAARGPCSDKCMAGIECDNACRKVAPTPPAEGSDGGELGRWLARMNAPDDMRMIYRRAGDGASISLGALRATTARIADLEARLAEAERQRDEHFREIKQAQRIIDEMKAWRATIYNASINADWVAVLLSEYPDPDSRSFVAVQIAEHCDRCIANALAAAESALTDARKRIGELEAGVPVHSPVEMFIGGIRYPAGDYILRRVVREDDADEPAF